MVEDYPACAKVVRIVVINHCPNKGSSLGQHRCVTHLYVIPMWNFNCVIKIKLWVSLLPVTKRAL